MVEDKKMKLGILKEIMDAMDKDVTEKGIKPKAVIVEEKHVMLPKKEGDAEELLKEKQAEPMDEEGMPDEAILEKDSPLEGLKEKIAQILESEEKPEVELEVGEEESEEELPFEGDFFEKLKKLKK